MTDDRISIEEIREFAEMTRDRPNELVYSEYVLALVEAVEAARANFSRGGPHMVQADVPTQLRRNRLAAAFARFDFGCDS